MRPLSDTVCEARETAKLSEATMARLLGIGLTELRRLERGQQEVLPSLLDRYAQIFGLSVARFMAGEAAKAPPALLFRTLHEDGGPTVDALAEANAHLILGEFVRCARDIADLRELLGERADRFRLDTLRPRSVDPVSPPPHGADRLAVSVREHLGLGTAPVRSMIDLLREQLGVDLLWVNPEELDRDIDGASAYCPNPAILVNLVGGAELWWRTRMTLAHELCHLIFDRNLLGGARQRSFLVFSPSALREGSRRGRSRGHARWFFSTEFESIERRAKAFAAYFLAPPEGVRFLVKDMDPASEQAITRVCHHYGVGRETAINVLVNVHHLAPEERLAMAARSHSGVLPSEHPDRYEGAVGLRAGVLQNVALRALAHGRIDRVQARKYLRCALTEPLPEQSDLSEEQRAPLRTLDERVRCAAESWLARLHAAPSCFASAVSRVPEGWQIAIEQTGEDAPPRRVGCVWLSQALDLSKQQIDPSVLLPRDRRPTNEGRRPIEPV